MLQKTHSSTLTDQERTCSFWSSLLAISQRQREQRFWLPMPSFVLHTTANSRALAYAYICRNACPTLSNVIYEKFLETPVAQTPTETLLDLTVDDGDHQGQAHLCGRRVCSRRLQVHYLFLLPRRALWWYIQVLTCTVVFNNSLSLLVVYACVVNFRAVGGGDTTKWSRLLGLCPNSQKMYDVYN